MKYLKKLNFLVLVFSILLPTFLLSCASEQEVITKDIAEKKLYAQAQRRLKSKNFVSAILTLETLEKRFPFGKYAKQAQIELVYAYYKSVNYDQAILAAERFINLHPRHPNVDYAFYIKGLAKFNNDKDLFASAPFLGEMTHKRELSEAKESFEDLNDFITRFPESEYAGNAKQRMIYLRNLIAKQEIYVAEFYIERKAFVAALARADYVLKYMPKTPQVERALEIMIISYQELGQDTLKADVEKALQTFKQNSNPG